MLRIREITQNDTEKVLEMMRIFYASPAVLSNGSEEIFRYDVENCVGNNSYLEGYIFTEGKLKKQNRKTICFPVLLFFFLPDKSIRILSVSFNAP